VNILIAEDDADISRMYSILLEDRGHKVIVTNNGEDCLVIYNNEFKNVTDTTDLRKHVQPFDAVILDHRIPKMKGFEVAKEIISINPHQRIIIASAYSKDIFNEVAYYVGLHLEIHQKPFSGNTLLNMLVHTILYEKMKKHLIEIEPVKEAKLRHEQLKAIADLLDKQDDD
jgi:DNA-binding NtrC family response regulator